MFALAIRGLQAGLDPTATPLPMLGARPQSISVINVGKLESLMP